jgi:2,3,4,5-tetrahydropyridine-2,6-dicarboxylate N-succinyltransferase
VSLDDLKKQIETLTKEVASGATLSEAETNAVIEQVIGALDCGQVRVAEFQNDQWITNTWVKEAILLYFKFARMSVSEVGPYIYHDKIPLKRNYQELNVRVVPPATARFGSFMEPGVVMMPCYINIGAYVGARTMVDTWATVGSCAQIGADVHLSGGVGIGGVLEPPSATPVIIEDGAFLGSRCIVVEGVHIGKQAVLASNVTLTASTPIIDVRHGNTQELRGHIPPRCVVVPGTREKKINNGTIHTACAYIIGERKPSTDLKTSLNSVLREFSLSV